MITDRTTTQAWKTRLYEDFARLQQLAFQLAAAASDHDLTAAELHATLDRVDTIRAEWEHAPAAARQVWAQLEGTHRRLQ
ncbi:hypothetical protein OHA40_26565 [Nocardia sp. NBC_00508]|uniref:hypothetical protein n=1 Tax=Nocardia sp. NBC_00508 TaxID=2975992 RepID=UPI002E80C136|nr:hypothetical protein [Nocardia sp. NBC_00508]WUD65176.1 hypothetical protein OHA40_26565 [Nocardia sp. NBC_00508]